MDNNIFDLSLNNAEKIYIEGKLHPIRVGMRQVRLQNGTKVILYDTTGVYTDNGYKIDTGKGLPKVRETWIKDRLENISIRPDFDFNSLKALSIEARQKLTRIKPSTIGQASRIPGVSPADINVLLVYFGR